MNDHRVWAMDVMRKGRPAKDNQSSHMHCPLSLTHCCHTCHVREFAAVFEHCYACDTNEQCQRHAYYLRLSLTATNMQTVLYRFTFSFHAHIWSGGALGPLATPCAPGQGAVPICKGEMKIPAALQHSQRTRRARLMHAPCVPFIRSHERAVLARNCCCRIGVNTVHCAHSADAEALCALSDRERKANVCLLRYSL